MAELVLSIVVSCSIFTEPTAVEIESVGGIEKNLFAVIV